MVNKGQFCKDCVHCVSNGDFNACCNRTFGTIEMINPVTGVKSSVRDVTLCSYAHGGLKCKYEER